MPQPSQTDVHIDAVLTNISVAYMQKAENFIAQKVFPVVPVDKQSDLYFIYNKQDWFRDEAEKRADATESAGSGYSISTDRYFADVWAFHKDVGDQVRENTDNPLDPDRDATNFVTQRLMMRQERQWVSDYFTPTPLGGTQTWGNEVVSTAATASNPNNLNTFTAWSDFAGSDPLEDIELGKETIMSTTGFEPNTLVLGYSVFRKLKNHPDFVDRIKYTSSESITAELLAKMFDVERVFIAKAIANTAAEGQAANYGFTHGKHALLAYVNPSPSLMAPSAGYVFTWKGVSDGLGTNIGITRFRMQHLRADRVEAQVSWSNKKVATDMAYMFDFAVA